MTEQHIAVHNLAFQIAKERRGITDTSALTSTQLSELCAEAEKIRREELTQEGQHCRNQSITSPCSGTSEKIPS